MTRTPETQAPSSLVEELRSELYSGLLRLADARAALGLSKHIFDQLVKQGELRVVRIGAYKYISTVSLKAYIAKVHAAANGAVDNPDQDRA